VNLDGAAGGFRIKGTLDVCFDGGAFAGFGGVGGFWSWSLMRREFACFFRQLKRRWVGVSNLQTMIFQISKTFRIRTIRLHCLRGITDSDMENPLCQTQPAGWVWEFTYSQLPELFFQRIEPKPVKEPRTLIFNHRLAVELGLDPEVMSAPAYACFFTGNRLPEGARPIAQAYAGHQFGHFTGLGDGRAILLGEHITPDGKRRDIQLKGSGRTGFSRGGDGRAAVGPMLREYLISEAMAALGIPTTRSLAVAATGETVMRDRPLPGAVLARVASSHIRVGTFQWAAAHQDTGAIRRLLAYTAKRHFPEIDPADARGFFQAAMGRQIQLIVEWMRVGFVHGVMNTDNMALSGETIDYGPCAFMDTYDPDTVFSSIDRGGRYAYANQPSIARWNLARLAETLLPLLHEKPEQAADFANETLGAFEEIFQTSWLQMMRGKIGLIDSEADDQLLIDDLLTSIQDAGLDFTNVFQTLTSACETQPAQHPPLELGALDLWCVRWKSRLARQNATLASISNLMRRSNPAVIPRNHLVEAALTDAEQGDFSRFNRLLDVLSTPYERPLDALFTSPPPPGSPKCVTFCGT